VGVGGALELVLHCCSLEVGLGDLRETSELRIPAPDCRAEASPDHWHHWCLDFHRYRAIGLYRRTSEIVDNYPSRRFIIFRRRFVFSLHPIRKAKKFVVSPEILVMKG